MAVKHIKNIPVETLPVGKGASKQVLIGPDESSGENIAGKTGFAMRRFIVEAGGDIPEHTNTVEHEQYVLHGRARLVIDGETYDVEPGSVVFMPAGAPHSYKNVGDEPFEFICVVPDLPDDMKIME